MQKARCELFDWGWHGRRQEHRLKEQVADLIADVLDAGGSEAAVAAVRAKVTALCRRFPVYGLEPVDGR